jgi:RNA methyltransferase, TrmH family
VSLREITGFSNPLVKRVRGLRDKKHRREEGLFLAEGLRILIEALDVGIAPVMLWYAPESAEHPLVRSLMQATEANRGDVFLTTADILAKLSGKDNPGTVIGVYEERIAPLAALNRAVSGIWLVAERLRDPGNLGTILRTGDAVGAGGLILIDDCTDPYSVESVRASMGAIFTQTVASARWPEFLEWLRSGPGQLIGTSLNTEIDYQTPRYEPPTFILIGNESQGLPETYESQCDILVKIPMMGKADSLNAAMATAVIAYEVLSQKRSAKSG